MKKTLWLSLLVFVLLVSGWVVYRYYSFLFARTVYGEIIRVERVTEVGQFAVAGTGGLTEDNMHSFAIAIKELGGEIVTGSGSDRQWAIAKAGYCAEAKFFRYPPWDLDKAGTYFNVRLLKLEDCNKMHPEPNIKMEEPKIEQEKEEEIDFSS